MSNIKRILALPADSWACGEYRVKIPYTNMPSSEETGIEFVVWDIVNRPQITFAEMSIFDGVLIQRPTQDVHVKLVSALQNIGIKVVVEIDDLLDWVHKDNYASVAFHHNSEPLNNFMKCMKGADAVSTSTPELAKRYLLKNDNRKIEVFLNCLNVNDPIYTQNQLRNNFSKDEIYVMWSGSSSHLDSLKLLKGMLEHVIMSYDNVKLVIAGNKEFSDLFDLPQERKIFIPGVKMNEYPIIPSMGDIFLTPVVESPFNDAKSELKILEAGIWGIPCVSSPVAPYVRFNEVSGGANLICKNNRAKNWTKNIKTLIENEGLRKELGEKSKQTVLNTYDLNKENEKRIKFWKEVLGN